MPRSLRWMATMVATFALTLAGAGAAHAQVTFAGTSNGYFNNNPGTTTLQGLSFSQGFDWGAFTLNPGESQNVQFGAFTLNRKKTFNYQGNTFNLLLNFTQPGIGDQVFTAALTGNINKNENGTLTVNFGNTFQLALGGALFDVTVGQMNLMKGAQNPVAVNGSIKLISGPPTTPTDPGTTVTPEPISMMLLGTGLAGVGAARRRKKKLDA